MPDGRRVAVAETLGVRNASASMLLPIVSPAKQAAGVVTGSVDFRRVGGGRADQEAD
jgi:hypothetical protein